MFPLRILPPSVGPSVKAEQIRLLYAQGPAIQILGGLTGIVAVWAFWAAIVHFWLMAWLAAHLVLTAFRLISTFGFALRSPTEREIIERWGPRYVLGTALSGIVWASLSFAYQPDWAASHQIVLFALFTGVTAASFITNAPYFIAFPAFYLPLVLGLGSAVVAHFGEGSSQLAILLLLYTAVMYFSALRFHGRLARALEISFENRKLADDLSASNMKLAELVDLDDLTGIANRRALDRYLATEWNRHCRTGHSLSMLFVDVDFFKQYNDTYGHDAGDHCLIRVAAMLRAQVQRAGELVARFGGEEFAVILPETDEAHALIVAESIRRSIENLVIPHAGSKISHILTLSVGGATVVPDQMHSPDQLRLLADNALYAAKNRGRNRVAWATADDLAAGWTMHRHGEAPPEPKLPTVPPPLDFHI